MPPMAVLAATKKIGVVGWGDTATADQGVLEPSVSGPAASAHLPGGRVA